MLEDEALNVVVVVDPIMEGFKTLSRAFAKNDWTWGSWTSKMISMDAWQNKMHRSWGFEKQECNSKFPFKTNNKFPTHQNENTSLTHASTKHKKFTKQKHVVWQVHPHINKEKCLNISISKFHIPLYAHLKIDHDYETINMSSLPLMTFVAHLTHKSHNIFLKDQITKLQLHDVVYNLKTQQASHTSIKGYNITAMYS